MQLTTDQLGYLLDHTGEDGYLLATASAHSAAPIILATGRPVFTFGGFTGSDPVIDLDGLQKMVASGELRFILAGEELTRSKPEIGRWVMQTCQPVNSQLFQETAAARVFDCGSLTE